MALIAAFQSRTDQQNKHQPSAGGAEADGKVCLPMKLKEFLLQTFDFIQERGPPLCEDTNKGKLPALISARSSVFLTVRSVSIHIPFVFACSVLLSGLRSGLRYVRDAEQDGT